MKSALKALRSVPVLISGGVILLACAMEVLQVDFLQRAALMTFDARVKFAQHFRSRSSNTATNLGFVVITDQSIDALNNGSLGYQYGLYWPRFIYGRALEELSAQGARAVAFDVIFSGLRPDHDGVKNQGVSVNSDDYFAQALRKSGNAILAADKGVMPAPLFQTNACAVASISTQRDLDGVLRRDKPYTDFYIWHPAFLRAAAELGFDLGRTRFEKNKLTLLRERESEKVVIPLDEQGRVDGAKSFPSEMLPEGTPQFFQPYTVYRAWSMGIVLAAHELHLDLEHAQIDQKRHQLVLQGPNGLRRVIPLDSSGFYYIDWCIAPENEILAKGTFDEVLFSQNTREQGESVTNLWKDKLVVVGSIATGNDLTDLGATPLNKETYLASKHWNVANSIISNQFITLCPLWGKLILIVMAGSFSAWVTWVVRPLTGSALVVLFSLAYVALGFWLFVQCRFWLPMALPLGLAALLTHICTVTYRVRVEQFEGKRVKSVFSKIVSPNVVNELLNAQKVSFGGVRRELTVFFADIRGFTELTDTTQTRAEEYVRKNNLDDKAAEEYFDEQARDILKTVSLCLGLIADTIKRHDGTLDKYIGDCVMAFWGAPTPDSQHAIRCVRAAIDAQRALHALNERRAQENRRIEEENRSRLTVGLPTKPLLSLVSLGTGINTGMAIVGLMGSDDHILNYTVFGREINLAARLEGVSGHGRIVVGEATYRAIIRDDPALAATCIELPPVRVKGFHDEVKAYEVPWRTDCKPVSDQNG